MHASEFVKSYFNAWNDSDAKGVAEHLTRNGVYCDVPSNERHSREQLVSSLVNFFSCEHNRYQIIGDVLSNDKSIAFQYKMISLSESTPDRFGAEFMLLDSEGVVSISDYYDPATSINSVFGEIDEQPPVKYAKSGLSDSQMGAYIKQLTHLMANEKVYLDADLTMVKLANIVDCSVNHLSQVVNAGFGMSFFDFLHSYRIEDAKALLENDSPQSHAILDIAFATGFNSNSAFYVAFKKSSGQTPAQYRRAHLSLRSSA